jgi:hypothetical protein
MNGGIQAIPRQENLIISTHPFLMFYVDNRALACALPEFKMSAQIKP